MNIQLMKDILQFVVLLAGIIFASGACLFFIILSIYLPYKFICDVKETFDSK
jgi:hypothetical protein